MLVEETEQGFEGFSASVPALPGCHSQGNTLEEAVANVKDAILAYLESLQARGLPIPTEDQRRPLATFVSVPVSA